MSYEKVAQMQSRVIIGIKQTLKAMKKDNVVYVYIARDAAEHVTEKVVDLASELNIPCDYVDSMKQLGVACGIDVGAATVGILRY